MESSKPHLEGGNSSQRRIIYFSVIASAIVIAFTVILIVMSKNKQASRQVNTIRKHIDESLLTDIPERMSKGNSKKITLSFASLDYQAIRNSTEELSSKEKAFDDELTQKWNQIEDRSQIINDLNTTLADIKSFKERYHNASTIATRIDAYADKEAHHKIKISLNRLLTFRKEYAQSFDNLEGAYQEMIYFIEENKPDNLDINRGKKLLVQLQEATNYLFVTGKGMIRNLYAFEYYYNQHRIDKLNLDEHQLDQFYIEVQDVIYDKLVIEKGLQHLEGKYSIYQSSLRNVEDYTEHLVEIDKLHTEKQHIEKQNEMLEKNIAYAKTFLDGSALELVENIRVEKVSESKGLLKLENFNKVKTNAAEKRWELTVTPVKEGSTSIEIKWSVKLKDKEKQEELLVSDVITKNVVIE